MQINNLFIERRASENDVDQVFKCFDWHILLENL